MNAPGLEIKGTSGSNRMEIGCEHQRGMLYVVRAERSWVCSDELLPAHALAGFFKQIAASGEPAVKEAMRQWGLYFRELPLEDADEESH